MSRYTYLACDMITGRVRERIRLRDDEWNLALDQSTPGSFEAMMSLAGRDAVTRTAWLDATEPGRSTIVPVRDGVPLGEWIIRERPARKNDASPVELYGEYITGYFHDVPPAFSNIAGDLPLAGWSATDPLVIAAALADQVAEPFTNSLFPPGSHGIALSVPGAGSSGQVVDRTEWDGQYQTVAEMMAELAHDAAPLGFEWTITVAVVNNIVVRTFKVGYPKLGIDAGVALQPAEGKPGGNATEVNCPDDGKRLATVVLGLGAGEGAGQTVTKSPNAALVDAYPARAIIHADSSIGDEAVLQSQTDALAAAALSSQVPPDVTVFADKEPVLGSYNPGDYFTLAMGQSTNFPNGNRLRVRLTGIKIKPPDAGPELVRLTVTSA